MIIVSLTTIPSRIPMIYLTINSILTQTIIPDKIILNIPLAYNNFKNNFTIPDNLANHPVIIINRCIDYGPATKLLGLVSNGVLEKLDNKDLIIVIDDDRIYQPTLIENFLKNHDLNPEYVLTVAGWNIETLSDYTCLKTLEPRGIEFIKNGFIDILGGCCGFALPKKLFPLCEDILKLDKNDSKYYVDDIWISGFLTLFKIPIYNIIGTDQIRHPNDSIDSLVSNITFARKKCNNDCIKFFRETYRIWC